MKRTDEHPGASARPGWRVATVARDQWSSAKIGGVLHALLATGITAGLIVAVGAVAERAPAFLLPWYMTQIVGLGLFAVLELVVILLVAKLLDGERPSDILPGRSGLRTWLLWGTGIGIIANGFAPAVLTLIGGGWLTPFPTIPVLAKVTAAIAVPLSVFWEEVVYRGYILRWLRPVGPAVALTLSSLAFAGLHFLAEPLYPDRFLVLFVMGILLGTAYIATGNLWFPIGLHFGINLVGFAVASDPYSGGLWRFAIAVPRNTHVLIVLCGLLLAILFASLLPKARREALES